MKHIILLSVTILLCCCVPAWGATYSYSPSQLSTLKTTLNGNLKAGDIVYLEDGTYNNFQVTFTGTGTTSSPITLAAKNPGKVILKGNLNLKMSGSYLVVDGLVFKDGQAASTDIVEFRSGTSTFANNCRLTNCVIDNCNNPDEKYRTGTDNSERWVMLYGKNNRVDHCYFANKINGGVLMMISVDNKNSQENNHIIDYNFFGDRPKFDPGNNAETIRIGDSKTSQLSSKTIIRNNFFYNCDGEPEIVSIKSCDNLIAQNTFYESAGSVVCRHGHRNTVEGNAFIGNDKKNTGGVRVINQGQQVRNNFFQEIAGTGSRSALCVMMGIFETPTSSTDLDKEPLNSYHRVRDGIVSDNTFINCKNWDLGTDVNYTYDSANKYYPDKKITGELTPFCAITGNTLYNPGTNSILNEISGNVSGITYTNNGYMFKSTINKSGFVYKSMNYQKLSSETGKGIYTLNGNAIKPFAAPGPLACGVSWYPAQQEDKNEISLKTDFWEKNPQSSNQPTANPLEFFIDNQSIRIYSPDALVEKVTIYDLGGRSLKTQYCKDYSCQIYISDIQIGTYILNIQTQDKNSISRKFRVDR